MLHKFYVIFPQFPDLEKSMVSEMSAGLKVVFASGKPTGGLGNVIKYGSQPTKKGETNDDRTDIFSENYH